ncbi:cobyrinate a,c-diamide synthase [Rhabdothermincola sediminis]|uniref:cobyrinate a,c-diamide synthase n=1 Tax=Rhabdothermincola sediminis TaxID=2751370 RepID=UPI001AA09A78|nr:cobyrinate a,c-diamide synthase [Rhabdothermincola sediminis]
MTSDRLGVLPPRVVIAGTRSGAGKTTVATGLLAAFTRAGVHTAAAKVGPDYIDPGYHELATGRPSRNLDPWMCGEDAVLEVAARAATGCGLLVIEGVMGLFDGAADATPSSTADVAALLGAPVLLVVDAAGTGRSVAATVHGFATFDPRVRVGGVILNRVATESHERMLRDALAPTGVPVLGALRRDDRLHWPDRHLGLVPVIERRHELVRNLEALAAAITEQVDLGGVRELAAHASRFPVPDSGGEERSAGPSRPSRVRIAVATGRAFSFCYPDNLEVLQRAGAELLPFDPLADRSLPPSIDGLYAGGGFPEIYAAELAGNVELHAALRDGTRRGLVVWAECGGLLWLTRAIDGHPMAAVVEAEATMTPRPTLGYRTATTCMPTPFGPPGTELRGHEFHYSAVRPAGEALRMRGREGVTTGGFGNPRMLASYLHLHLAGHEHLATRFVETCRTGKLVTPTAGESPS